MVGAISSINRKRVPPSRYQAPDAQRLEAGRLEQVVDEDAGIEDTHRQEFARVVESGSPVVLR